MSFINEFEERIGSIFGEAPGGYTEPISFKKLAKQAAREMDREVLVAHGVETAPALYTILVSAADDQLMRPFYPQITEEASAYIYAQAKLKGYAFVGTPLVRFMVDPGLRSGRFAVFAENVDAATLAQLRNEERAFLGIGTGSAKAQQAPAEPQQAAAEDADSIAEDADPFAEEADPFAEEPEEIIVPLPEEMEYESPLPSFDEDLELPYDDDIAMPAAVPAAAASAAAASQLAAVSALDLGEDEESEPAEATPHACMLIDRLTGHTYKAESPSAIIGRERSQSDIVIADPNASRIHAQLSYDGAAWHITDRRSTNGTLVNDVDVTESILKTGDIVTIGLTNLEFREL